MRAISEVLPEVMAEVEKALEFYADSDNHENEMIGFAFVPETSPVFHDGGRRARKALKVIREVSNG